MGDYDRKPKESSGMFLRLKSKEEKCRIRILASPLREPQIWIDGRKAPMPATEVIELSSGQWATIMRKPDYRIAEVYHFIVMDRADGQPKIFSTTGGVYGKVRDFAKNEEWGDPKNYDLTITRTEMPGKNYYEVVPSPQKSDLTPRELEAADKLLQKIKDENVLPAALPASVAQPDDIDEDTEPEDLPGQGSGERVYQANQQYQDEPPGDPNDMPTD